MGLEEEILEQLRTVCESKQFSYYKAVDVESQGKVRELEDLFCDYFNVKYAIATNSATSALHCACVACGVGLTIVPTITFSASASCVLMAGGSIVFADIEPETYCVNTQRLPNAQAIIAVHLHGQPCDMDNLPSIKIIEDCSQAIGAEYKGRKVGTIGDCGVFSFNQCKHITSGEGGMLITNDDKIAEIARAVRNHGEVRSEHLGYNYRMTELQACVLIPQFKRLDDILDQRRELCKHLTERLSNIEGLTPPIERKDCKHSYFTYPVKANKRDELQTALLSKGVYFGKGGYKPLHLFPFYKKYYRKLLVAEDCYKKVMFTDIIKPPMTFAEVDKIAELIRRFYG